MALRQPSTPRTLLSPTLSPSTSSPALAAPGHTPGRRKSTLPTTPSNSSDIETRLAELQAAMAHTAPARYESPSVDPNSFPLPVPDVKTPARTALRRPSTLNLRATFGASTSASTSRPTTPVSGAPSLGLSTPRTPSHGRATSAPTKDDALEIGDEVKMEIGGTAMEGTLRFLGEVEGKDGSWAGVELGSEWAGLGKNDGSVRGTQYFACPPLCGLFLPLSKISLARPRPPVTRTAKLSMAARRPATASPSSPTKPQLRSSSSPSKVLLAPSAQATPRAKPRQSMGLPTPRKSLAASTSAHATPRAVRPPSSLREHPPLPSAVSSAFGRSMTPSGRGTPSTPSASRRLSVVSHSSSVLDASRPTTPSVRSFSRQSFASASSRSAAGSAMGGDVDDWREREAMARQREADVRVLLVASEAMGRAHEGSLADREHELRELRDKLDAVEKKAADERRERLDEQQRREREREREAAARAEAVKLGEGDNDNDKAAALVAAATILDLERQLLDHSRAADSARTALERLTREIETKSAAKEGEIESLRERLADRDDELQDQQDQIEKLREAGRAICAQYEERISGIESRRLEAEERLVELEMKVEVGRDEPVGDEPGLLFASTRSAADLINAETAQAEVEHLRTKVGNLEEQLEETRQHLEAEVSDTRRRRQKSGDIELMLKKEVKDIRLALDKAAKAETRLAARIEELEDALAESQAALEDSRSEVEGLRHDAGTSLVDDLSRANKQILSLSREAARNAEIVDQLRDDLRAAEKELSASHLRLGRQGSVNERSPTTTPVQQPTQDTPNLHPSPSNSRKRDSVASAGSRRSIGPKDDVAALREQIVGLKVIIQTLTDDNQNLVDRNKTLMSESTELRDAQRALETTVDNLMNEMSSGVAPTAAASAERASVQAQRQSSIPLQRELDALKLTLKEAEKASQREVKALKQEVSELEGLIESKVYREDELEFELEKLKGLVKGGHSRNGSAAMSERDDAECEMCGEKGHDLDSCPDFGGGKPSSTNKMAAAASANGAEFCDDCEEYGHSLEACPLQNEMF